MRRTLVGGGWARLFFALAAAAGFCGLATGPAGAGSVATAAFAAPGPVIAALAGSPDTALTETPEVAAPETLPELPTPEGTAPDGGPKVTLSVTPALDVKIKVPALKAVGSNIDEAKLKDILSGKVSENAEAIANLSATSVTIPEIDVAMTIATGTGKVSNVGWTLRDIAFDTVTAGVARSVAIGSMETRSDEGGSSHLDKISAEQVNLGLMLQLYGLVKGDPTAPLSLAYSDFTGAGGTLSGPGSSCTFGKFSTARVEARPLKVSLGEFPQLLADVNAENGTPTRQAIGRLAEAYADLLAAFRSTPLEFGGFNCNGVGEESVPFKFAVGGMTIGVLGGPRYPDFIVRDIDFSAGEKGTFSLGAFHLKGFDFSSTLVAARALSKGEGDTPTEKELRALIPPFAGFALSDVSIDVPDEEEPGQRVKATLADFDLDLGNYINGIPSQFSSYASHLVVALPAASSNSAVQTLLSVGLHNVDFSYDLAAYWDAPSKEIRLTRFALEGAHLGRIEASGVIGQVDDVLFSMGEDALAEGVLDPTVKRVNVHIVDNGLGDLLAKAAAGGSGKGVAEIRRSSAALVQATLLFFLGGAAGSADVGAAVGKFMNGARSLSVSALANDPAGVAFHVLQSLTDNPADIGNQITIDAVAR